ncbi:cytochrome P450 CYP82D47-like [Cucumis melo var. makuwa]|uniref:Cytochrome P450 CYP82D47-like n=2 Tax=Cucumis melo TaxID=3656 RepID=A0A5D3DU72_CUCMM|nr:cytochrome P450 CYP82D47-like [Cucumis melo var. makuwa]TYK26850.1 cytochrome P450 CYP82D47-like [Cucumis melo var. makuwa]
MEHTETPPIGIISSYLYSVGAGLFLLVLSFFFVLKKATAHKRKEPPEVDGRWPIIGHLQLLKSDSQLPHQTLGALADKYGPIFRIRFGAQPTLIISSSELAKQCHTTLDSIVSSHPKSVAGKLLGYNYAAFGTRPYDSFYRSMRKIVVSEVLSNRRLELQRDVRVSEVKKSLKQVYNQWTKREEGSNSILVDVEELIGNINLKVVLMMVCGKRFLGVSGEVEEMKRYRKVMRDFLDLLGKFVVGDSIPFLRWLDVGGHEKAMKITSKQLDSLLEEWLEDHRRKRNSGAIDGEHGDLMDVLLSNLEGMDLAGYDADTVIKATCTSIITGGTDTVTISLAWAVSLLLNNREVLRRAQEELDIHVGNKRLVEESDISKLVYLQAVVNETLRLYPPGPLSGIRLFSEDCTVGGYNIAAGTHLITNIWKIHTNPEVWAEPLEFKPERFLNRNKQLDVKGQRFDFIPFGCGRRACPGMNLGIQMTQLMLASLIHSFELNTRSDGPVDMAVGFGIAMYRTNPLEVLVKPRLLASAYV